MPAAGRSVKCRPGCAACCVQISISSALPGMPRGKPAGARCRNLNVDNLCSIYGTREYPAVCENFKPSEEMCGDRNEQAMAYLENLEKLTK
jgi:Fe-S-cluster containining protein